MIELSVVIPMFRAKYIGWLALESLVRQQGIDFEWELIIAEEIHDEAMGKTEIMGYEKKLKDIGCVNFEYIGLSKWISLGEKIHLLINKCDSNTKVFVRYDADDYSVPLGLATHHKIFKSNNFHFFVPTKAIHYNIVDGTVVVQDTEAQDWKGRKDDVVGKAWSYEIVKQTPKINKRSSMDGWLYRKVAESVGGFSNIKIYFDRSDNWKYGFSTCGLNNLTFGRLNRMKQLIPPFYKCPINLYNTIPPEILEMLENCKQYVKKHKRGLP